MANTEAEGFSYSLGTIKVMGQNSGFIAMHLALGSCVANLCLVPEVDFYLGEPRGVVDRIQESNKAVGLSRRRSSKPSWRLPC